MTDGRDEADAKQAKPKGTVPVLNVGPSTGSAAPPTVVVLGASRSGTTMTAGVLQILGVEFGDRIDDRAEDVDITRCLRRTRSGLRLLSAPSARREFAGLLRQRRARWGTFGFKAPELSRQLPLMAGVIPEAFYVCVLRNPLPAALSAQRHTGRVWVDALASTARRQTLIAHFLRRTDRPVAVFTHEGALADPAGFVQDLAAFLSLTPSSERVATARRFVDPRGGYRPTRRTLGAVEAVSASTVRGWVADLADPVRSLEVELVLGERLLARTRANEPRPEVAARGLHESGRCGFTLAIPPGLGARERERLVVTVPEVGHAMQFRADASGAVVYDPRAALASPAPA